LKYFFVIYDNYTYKLIMTSKYVLFGNFTLKETKQIMKNTTSEIFPAYIRYKYFNPCLRCGRDGHHYSECFSKKTIRNIPINDGWNDFNFSERDLNMWISEQKQLEKEEKKTQLPLRNSRRTHEEYMEDLALTMALDYTYQVTNVILAQQALAAQYRI